MIDFKNGGVFKLSPAGPEVGGNMVNDILVGGEQLLMTFKAIRDIVVFTNKRIIVINVQGLTGKKKDVSSLPYARIQAFSVETAGNFDLDSELELWFSGLGRVKLEFSGRVDIRDICRFIGDYVLK
jgi:hypothetical protein